MAGVLPNNFRATMDPITAFDDPNAVPKLTPPPAKIRPFNPSTDLKVCRYIIGASVMEPSSIANRATLWSPIGLLIWALLTHVIVLYGGGGWPESFGYLLSGDFFFNNSGHPSELDSSSEWMKWLTLLPLLAAPPIVLLASFELKHRNEFERDMTRVIGEEDMRDITGYYGVDDLVSDDAELSSSSATTTTVTSIRKGGKKEYKGDVVLGEEDGLEGGRKGFWVLEYDNRIIGVFGIDGRKPLVNLASVIDLPRPKSSDHHEEESEKSEASHQTIATSTSTSTDSPMTLRNRKTLPTPSISITPSSPTELSSSTFTSLTAAGYKSNSTLHIRRFATSMSFRPAGIEDDLLVFASAFAFSPSSSPNQAEPAENLVISARPTLQKAFVRRLQAKGFIQIPEKGGERKASSSSSTTGGLLQKIWPIDTKEKTYILTRTIWEEKLQQ